ncbi:MAG: hypothetical protein C0482_22025 [Gordonia sp.]|nr:hypothetical protein [Gordonia sp. (in: high G+C Gram-positive bacteria)]
MTLISPRPTPLKEDRMSYSNNTFPHSEFGSPYDAETPVNLRAQTLRRVTEPDPELETDQTDDTATDDPTTDPGEARPLNAREAAEALRAQITAPRRTPSPEAGDAPTVEFTATPAPLLPTQTQQPLLDNAIPDIEDDEVYREQVRRAGLLTASPGIETDPAEWGKRGWLNQTLGMKLAPQPEEIDYRYDTETITRAVLPPWFQVMIANPKGGQGKTPTTLMLAYIFGMFYGAGIVAWDNTESKGTLADRAEATTDGEQLHVWDLLEHAADLAGPNASAGALNTYLRRQPGTKVDVLASDSTSSRAKAIGAAECDAIVAVLRRHRVGVFVDTAGEDLSDNWQWTAAYAHQLVIPMTYRRDAARAVLEMLDGLRERGGRSDLVAGAVVAIAATPGSADPADRDAIIADLHDLGITRIVDVPYEPLFEGSGTRIAESQLAYTTHVAYTRVAAEIADRLAHLRIGAPVEYTAGDVPASITRPAPFTAPASQPGYGPPVAYMQQMAAAPNWQPGALHQPMPGPMPPHRTDSFRTQGGNR